MAHLILDRINITFYMTPKPKNLQLGNRARRIPRRIREIQSELKSFDARIAEIEDSAQMDPVVKENFIRDLRKRTAPYNQQIRALVDRGNDLGLRIAA